MKKFVQAHSTLRSPSAKAIDIKNTLLHWLSDFRPHKGPAQLYKTITADNGLEFASIGELEIEDLQVFFAHLYTAWEGLQGLLRRMIPKGTAIRTVSEATLRRATEWHNTLPRKILNYRTSQEAFLEEVEELVDLESVQFHIAI